MVFGPLVRKALMPAAFLAAVSMATPAQASLIDFEDFTGPPVFAVATAGTYIRTVDGVQVTVSGGGLLDQTTNLPANQTTLYGTADFAPTGFINPLTVTFDQAISNFFLDVYNGLVVDASYLVSDNAGNSALFTLAPNLPGGTSQIGFAATGTVITIQSMNTGGFDFFIDNIHFNESLPGTVPEPGTIGLFGVGLAIVGWRRFRRA